MSFWRTPPVWCLLLRMTGSCKKIRVCFQTLKRFWIIKLVMIFMSVTLSSDFVVINYQAQTISQVSVVSLGNKSSPPQLHHITFKKLLFSSVFLSEVLGDSARTAVERKYSFSTFSWHQGKKLPIYLLGPSLSLSWSNSCCYRMFVQPIHRHRHDVIEFKVTLGRTNSITFILGSATLFLFLIFIFHL